MLGRWCAQSRRVRRGAGTAAGRLPAPATVVRRQRAAGRRGGHHPRRPRGRSVAGVAPGRRHRRGRARSRHLPDRAGRAAGAMRLRVPPGQGPGDARRGRHAGSYVRRARRPRPGAVGAREGGTRRVGGGRPAARGRAVEHVGGLRRAADPQGVPPGVPGAQPRRGDHQAPRRAGLSPRRAPAGRAAIRGVRPGRRAAVPAGVHRRLGSRRSPRCATCSTPGCRPPRRAATSAPRP